MEKVASIFGEVQKRHQNSMKENIKKLISIIQSEPEEKVQEILTAICRGCFDTCLLCAKKEPEIEKMIKFLADFVSSSLESIGVIFNTCMDHLLKRSEAVDKVIRYRACQIIHLIMGHFPPGEDRIDDDLIQKMITVLSRRFSDKAPNVRVWAIKALSQLQEEGGEVVKEISRLMLVDTSKDVRVTAVERIYFDKDTLPLIIDRIKDVRPEVRIAVFKKLSSADFSTKKLNRGQKALIVRFGLKDRDPNVRNECKSLILKLLSDYKNDVPRVLHSLGFEESEEEIELLGSTVMEIVMQGDNVPHELSQAVRQQCPNWDKPVSSMSPSEILWAFIRCEYASKHLSQVTSSDFIDALVPDMVKLCDLLQEARKPALYSSAKYQIIVRYLLKLTVFLETSDICGCKKLVSVCQDMLIDTNLPEMLVDPMLNSWLIASGFGCTSDAIKAAVELSQRVTSPESNSAPKRMSGGEDNEYGVAFPGDSDEEEDEDKKERKSKLSSIRSLQIIAWSLQHNVGSRDAIKGCDHYDDVVEFLQGSLQQAEPDMRGLSVRCLGLLALYSEEKCDEFHEILFLIARNEIEIAEIRVEALKALVDMATIYDIRYQNDMALTLFLIRLQEDYKEPALLRVGAESAAKLLFSGRLTDPKLFANLLKFFFLPELATSGYEDESEKDGNEKENEPVEDAFFGSTARLQQILSVFFQTFFMGGIGREKLAFSCVSELVADLAMLIRNKDIGPAALGKMANHLLALCENIKKPFLLASDAVVDPTAENNVPLGEIPLETGSGSGEINFDKGDKNYPEQARNIFRMRLTAAISREILKCDKTRRIQREMVKEFIKVMGGLTPQAWIQKSTAPTVFAVFDTISQSFSLEKSSEKIILEKIVAVCEEIRTSSPGQEGGEEQGESEHARFEFYNLALGLADEMNRWDEELAEDKTKNLRNRGREFADEMNLPQELKSRDRDFGATVPKKKRVPAASKAQTNKKDEEEEEEEEEEDEDESEEELDSSEDEKESEKEQPVVVKRKVPISR